MSYGRDRDAYTRGAGAIAAADFGNARRAAARRAKVDRSAALDARRAELTYGPYGGLGRISGAKIGVPGPALRAPSTIDVPPQSGPLGPRPVTPPGGAGGGGRGGRSLVPLKVGRYGLAVSPGQPAAEPGTNVGPSGATVGLPTIAPPSSSPGGRTGTDVPVTPVRGTSSPRPPTTVVVSGGGSGGPSGGKGSPLPLPTPAPLLPSPTLVIDEIPDVMVAPTPTPTRSRSKLLLIAALAGGAYLVLRNKKGRP